jgi:hypothetical protein
MNLEKMWQETSVTYVSYIPVFSSKWPTKNYVYFQSRLLIFRPKVERSSPKYTESYYRCANLLRISTWREPKLNSVVLVTERPQPVGEVSANF